MFKVMVWEYFTQKLNAPGKLLKLEMYLHV